MAPAGVVHRAEPGAADGAVNARPRSLLGKRLIVPGARRGAGLLARDDAFWRHQPGASPAWRHARRRSATRSRGLVPCRRSQWLAVGIDGRLHILGEVGIERRRVAELLFIRLRRSDALADFPARTLRRLDDGHGRSLLTGDRLNVFLRILAPFPHFLFSWPVSPASSLSTPRTISLNEAMAASTSWNPTQTASSIWTSCASTAGCTVFPCSAIASCPTTST